MSSQGPPCENGGNGGIGGTAPASGIPPPPAKIVEMVLQQAESTLANAKIVEIVEMVKLLQLAVFPLAPAKILEMVEMVEQLQQTVLPLHLRNLWK